MRKSEIKCLLELTYFRHILQRGELEKLLMQGTALHQVKM